MLKLNDNEPVAIPPGLRAEGRVVVPPSKSYTHRCIALSLAAQSPVEIVAPLSAEDTELFFGAAAAAGYRLERADGVVVVGPRSEVTSAVVDCGNAGTMFRLLTGMAAAVPGDWRLDGTPRLRERPIAPLVVALRELGAQIDFSGAENCAPLTITGGTLRGGHARVDASMSSQYLSALLLAAVNARSVVELDVESLTSSPYVDITLDVMAEFGLEVAVEGSRYRVEPQTFPGRSIRVEADFSAAPYPAVAALLTGGSVELEGLNPSSSQGDRQFLGVLEDVGAEVEWIGSVVRVSGGDRLEAVDVDLGSTPDQVPTLAALAPFCRGTTRIRGVPHLRVKESDRLSAMATELERVGVPVTELPDGLVIEGVWSEEGSVVGGAPAVIQTYDDHRIAMSMALLALRRNHLMISTPKVVEKSYPDFWKDLDRILVSS